jgi:hypothetical protein
MKKFRNEAELRAHIRRMLSENMGMGPMDVGSSYDVPIGMGGMGGGPFYSQGSLKKIFVQPFANAIGVATGKVKEMARRAIGLIQVAFEAVVTTIVPFLTDSYDEIFEKQEQDLEKIKGEYSSYYREVDEALRGDLAPFAFLAFPGAALAGKFVEDAPDAAKKILSVATGGLSDDYLSGKRSKKSPGNLFNSYARSYAKLLREAEEGGEKEQTLADKIGSKKFIEEMLDGSPTMRSASKEIREIYRSSLKKVYDEAAGVLGAKKIEDIEKATGKKIPKADEIKKLKPEERKRGEEELMKVTKQALKKYYKKRLEDDVAPVAEIFGEDFPFVQDYKKVIDAIEKL